MQNDLVKLAVQALFVLSGLALIGIVVIAVGTDESAPDVLGQTLTASVTALVALTAGARLGERNVTQQLQEIKDAQQPAPPAPPGA